MGVSVWIENNKHETSRQAGSTSDQTRLRCRTERTRVRTEEAMVIPVNTEHNLWRHVPDSVGSGGCLAGWLVGLAVAAAPSLSLCLDEFVMCANFPSGTQICQDKKFTSMFGNWLLIAEILHLNPWDAVPTDEYELVHGQSSSPSIGRRCLILVVHIIIIIIAITVITTAIIRFRSSIIHHQSPDGSIDGGIRKCGIIAISKAG